jgi:hypothetical protein
MGMPRSFGRHVGGLQMPGKGSYGPNGKWVHDRAERILSKGELQGQYGKDAKSVAYAIATQQSRAAGKAPKKKNWGTPEGKKAAKAKHGKPKGEYKKTASMAGQDLRGQKGMFPTDDSKQPAAALLNKSQKAAEVGPAPSFSKISPKGPSAAMLAPMPAMPKLAGVPMHTLIEDDPLVQYLQKHAEVLEDNANKMLTPKSVESEHHEREWRLSEEANKRHHETRCDVLDELFVNEKKPARSKQIKK